MRRKIIAANWKMNKTASNAIQFIKEIKPLISAIDNVDIIILPSFSAIGVASSIAKASNIRIGSQDIHHEESGAYTSGVSAMMVSEFCNHVLIGHSERREFCNDTDQMVNKKVLLALSYGLIPIVCIGETSRERDEGKTNEVLHRQIFEALKRVNKKDLGRVIIAYEPRWAISRGDPNHVGARAKDASEAHSYIRSVLEIIFDKESSECMRLIYGGSARPENLKDFLSSPDVDGALVGKASEDAARFVEMIKITSL